MKKTLMILVALILILFMVPAIAEAVDTGPAQPGIDLTPVFQAIIAFLAALITYKLIPWINARTTIQQQEKLRSAVKVAVFAAEQLYGAGKGKEKLLYVKDKLAGKGFHIDIDEIEAKVQELKLGQQAAMPVEIRKIE